MKKLIIMLPALLLLLGSCSAPSNSSSAEGTYDPSITLNCESAKSNYSTFAISTMVDGGYTAVDGVYTFATAGTYVLSGYLAGRLVVSVKDVILEFNGAYIESSDGYAVINSTMKIEISPNENTINYLVQVGTTQGITAALFCEKSIELGGSGTMTIVGSVQHAVKGSDVSIKGSKGTGIYYLQGTIEGSAINANTVTVAAEKIFNVYCINSKNGIKADETITIASGSFHIYDCTIAMKTDVPETEDGVIRGITLSGGSFEFHACETLFLTVDSGVTIADSVTMTNENQEYTYSA